MKRIFAVVICTAAICAGGDLSNRRAPGFSIMDTHFQQYDLQDYRGKIVLIDFMQTGCPVCNALADALGEVKTRYGDKLAILSIVTLPDNFETVDSFAARHQIHWPILFDSGQVMMSYLKLQPTGNMNVHFPHIFLVDGAGTIRSDFDGSDEKMLLAGSLSAEIDRLVKEKR